MDIVMRCDTQFSSRLNGDEEEEEEKNHVNFHIYDSFDLTKNKICKQRKISKGH